MHVVTGAQAETRGLQLRDYIVLSALHKSLNLTQVELAKTLGLDKTTLMTQLDRLEKKKLIVRRTDAQDRRARIPELTHAGNDLRAQVARACTDAEANALTGFTHDDVGLFRRMLFEIIGDSEDPGSCL
ncbi:MAG: winged helix-turn-helix transcriptional regulator [Luteimonas sp.]|nr:winged helix-turn-helix transcriptional regulator [Luteimonas sp.]